MGGLRVLVVDDEAIMRNIVRRYLRRCACEVYEAANVGEAREALERAGDAFGLVITDYRMPGGTGQELIDWIRVRWPVLPIILMSGDFMEPMPPAAHVHTLAKPFGGEAFAETMREALGATAT